jgi:glycosyltransferase involved in cell wall biosynthesis
MDISIIIPCYNSGAYLCDALSSISNSKNINTIDHEIIIIDDGSTDEFTINFLDELNIENCTIIHQQNRGPASARNTGVKASNAPNLLFLDSDNKIRPNFINTALRILKKGKADIVYGKAHFFGDINRDVFKAGPFDMNSILLTNYIDMCSVMRKKVWEGVGGFDEALVLMGFEDWEFWIRAGAGGYTFQFVNEVLFDYRVNSTSLLANKNVKENYDNVVDYVYEKHAKKIQKAYRNLYPQFLVYERDQRLPLRSFFKFFYMKYIKPFYNYEKKWQKALKQQ